MMDGYFAEYALVDARHCAKLPDNMEYKQASTAHHYPCIRSPLWRR